MMISGGVALLTNSADSASRTRYLATQARQPAVHYEHVEIGYNYRMSNLLAALGRAQLARLDAMIARRREITRRYSVLFAGVPGVQIFGQPDGLDGGDAVDNFWLTLGSIIGLVMTFPLQAGVAIAVWRVHGRPVLVRQERPGKDGRPFTLLKSRTMLPIDETKSTDADRLTLFRKALRATSLDELPSLWNLLRGDMSLVGPRPLLVRYPPLYSPEQDRRHEVCSGVIGLAQVRGRNATTWQARLAADVEYVDKRSLMLGLHILLTTLLIVLRGHGISADGEATMAEFAGAREVRHG